MQKTVLAPADAGGGALRAREPFAAFVLDDASRQAAILASNEQGWTGARVADGGIAGAIESLGDMPTPGVLLIDVSESTDPIQDINRLAEVCQEGTHVIAVGSLNDVDLFRRLIQAGVDDYLVKPINPDALKVAFANLTRSRVAPPQAPANPGRLVLVVGARGGVGASALAANLAWLAGHMQDGRRAALVDLDLQFGSAALALDIEPGRGLADALRTPSRIDDLLIERASVKVDEQFSVLCAEEGLETPLQVDPTAIDSLIERLRLGFDCVIVEMPRSLVPSQSQLIAAADAILVVADYTLVSARDCPRLLTRLKEARPKGTIKVAVNRVGAPGHGEIKRPDLEKALGTKVNIEIPHDAQTATQSLQAGKPMVVAAKKAKTCGIIRSLAMDICDMAPAAKPPLWRRLLGKAA
ncbi:MAG: AAA family ATPase [Rhodospirillales bacterium]|nr:AAA family ATPase [Rhodospirillales bacterium]